MSILTGRKSVAVRHRKAIGARPGARIARCRKLSIYIVLAFLGLTGVATTMVVMEIGIPGRAWHDHGP